MPPSKSDMDSAGQATQGIAKSPSLQFDDRLCGALARLIVDGTDNTCRMLAHAGSTIIIQGTLLSVLVGIGVTPS